MSEKLIYSNERYALLVRYVQNYDCGYLSLLIKDLNSKQATLGHIWEHMLPDNDPLSDEFSKLARYDVSNIPPTELADAILQLVCTDKLGAVKIVGYVPEILLLHTDQEKVINSLKPRTLEDRTIIDKLVEKPMHYPLLSRCSAKEFPEFMHSRVTEALNNLNSALDSISRVIHHGDLLASDEYAEENPESICRPK